MSEKEKIDKAVTIKNKAHRLDVVCLIFQEISNRREIKKGVDNDINAARKGVDEIVAAHNEAKANASKTVDSAKELRKITSLFKRIAGLESQRKTENAKINKLNAAASDCAMGRGDYDGQINFEDIYNEEDGGEDN